MRTKFARFEYVNYDLLHKFSETVFRMLLVKLRCNSHSVRKEGPRRVSA